MLRIIGLIIVVGAGYLFLNWDEYSDDVNAAVEKIDQAAEKTSDAREAINDKIEELKE